MKYHRFISYSLFCSLTLIASCGRDYSNGTRAPSSVGGVLNTERSLTATEKSKALGICYAFKSKKATFQATQIGATFSFQIDESKCDNTKYSAAVDTTLKQVLLSAPIVFDSNDTKLIFNEVQTSDYGVLMPVCESLFLGDEAGNTYESASGDKLSLSFKADTKGEWLVIDYARATLDASGNKVYEIYQKDSHRIEVNASAVTPTYGMILESERVATCDNSTRKYTYTQVFKP